jgi:predicted transposase/invertase (TIGR01784 family)
MCRKVFDRRHRFWNVAFPVADTSRRDLERNELIVLVTALNYTSSRFEHNCNLFHPSNMTFADLKNDFVFRRIFAKHPDILRGLLNDLLERTGDQTIESIEYLPSEQLPLVAGAKLSILDVRCVDRSGVRFIVEMQIIHVPGFLNRVVYNGCKAYVDQLKAGEPYTKLTDVVAISICDFELWPDAEQDAQRLPRVPMLSRWYVTESSSNHTRLPDQESANRLLHVQYAFLELPKLPDRKPDTGALLWAWLFVHAPELTEVPTDLPSGPYREALALANEATFSQTEMDAYRKVMDEIQQAREYGEAKEAEGFAKGETAAKAAAVLAILSARGLSVSGEARARIEACADVGILDRWITRAAMAASSEEIFAAASEEK